MFCNSCGTQLLPEYRLCPRCGKPVSDAAVSPSVRLPRHLRRLGVLWIIVGGLFVVPGIILLLLAQMNLVIPGADEMLRRLGPVLLSIAGSSFLVVGAGGICVGWGLIEYRSWARTCAIVLGVLALFHPPFGTALGIYTLWVLLSQDAQAEYRRMSAASA